MCPFQEKINDFEMTEMTTLKNIKFHPSSEATFALTNFFHFTFTCNRNIKIYTTQVAHPV